MNREKLFQLFISFMYIVFLTFYTLYNLIWQGIGIYIYIVWSIFLIFLLFFVIDLFCRIIVDSKRLLYFLLKTTTKRKPNLRAITIEKFLSEVTEIVIASHRYVQLSFLLLLIALNSIILFDIKYLVVEDNRFPPSYASNEELEIVNYIKNSRVYSSETYFTLCSTHYLIETRIGAYAGILFLSDTSEVNLMITGYLDRSNVIQNSTLKPPTQWLEGPIFNYNTGYYYSYNEKEPLATKTFWRVVMRNPYNSSDAQKVIKAFNILFFVKLKESDIAYFRLGDTFLSPFAETIPENFIVYETNHLFLYQLPNS